jgi:hypothetical protein
VSIPACILLVLKFSQHICKHDGHNCSFSSTYPYRKLQKSSGQWWKVMRSFKLSPEEAMISGSVTTAWHILRLWMEEWPPDMDGTCEYIE